MRFTPRLKLIVLAGFLAGTLDALAAIVLLANMHAKRVFQFIASALLGRNTAFQGGMSTAILGLALHYFIAFSFTVFFFLIYPRLSFLRKNALLDALLYGIFVWLVMNLIVLPLVGIHQSLTTGKVVYNMIILTFTIGLPVSFLARKYYTKSTRQ
jgi:uncharacterized membrane protein YagU involved in acid resistance